MPGFQLYFSGDGSGTFKLVDRARAGGYKTLILTVDVPKSAAARANCATASACRSGWPWQFLDFALHPRWSISTLLKGKPQMANFLMEGFEFDRTESRAKADWDTLARLRDRWPGKLVVKGVLDFRRRGCAEGGRSRRHPGLEPRRPPVGERARADLGPAADPGGGRRRLSRCSTTAALRSGEDALKALMAGADFLFLRADPAIRHRGGRARPVYTGCGRCCPRRWTSPWPRSVSAPCRRFQRPNGD